MRTENRVPPIRRAGATAVVGLLMTGLFAVGSGATVSASEVGATAHPSGCTYAVSDVWGSIATCSKNNGGTFAATVTCRFSDGKIAFFDGPWKKSGRSIAYCQGDSKAVSAGIWTKAS
ncbi:hypothetical protein [Streptomyces sp. NPDC096193]|uniref:hypothetical protein n=1 Tax=Streptomyces sp. NPDC096193 TaxID=3155821 RepID=UPI003326892C